MPSESITTTRRSGRPSAFSSEIARRICSLILTRDANGTVRSLKSICAEFGMPTESTVYAWLLQHNEFSEMYARAREQRGEMIAEDVIEIADTEADPHKARVRIDARKWAASKLAPKVFGDKVEAKTTFDASDSLACLLGKLTSRVIPDHAGET